MLIPLILLTFVLWSAPSSAQGRRFHDIPISSINLWDLFYSDVLDKVNLDEFFRQMIEDFRQEMRAGLPSLGIPVLDPFTPEDVDEYVNDQSAKAHVVFRNIRVEGLADFVLERLETSLKYLFLNFHVVIPEVRASAYYELEGKAASIFPLRGNGSCWLRVENATLGAHAELDSDEVGGKLRIKNDFDLLVWFDKLEGDFENILGGGRWTEVMKKLLFGASANIFKLIYPKVKKSSSDAFRDLINKRLSQLPIEAIKPGSTANEYIDQIMYNVQKMMVNRGLDPMELPDYHANFTSKKLMVTWTGEVHLFNGVLEGLRSLHRAGECELDASGTFVSLAVHLGLKNLRVNYKGKVKFMSMGPSIGGGATIKEVSFFLKIRQSNLRGSSPELEDFHIVKLSTVWVELTGLGPLSYIIQWLATGITKMIENSIKEKVTAYIREYITEELKGVSFPIGR